MKKEPRPQAASESSPYRRKLSQGEVLMKEGERDNRFFVLEAGILEVFIQGRRVARIEAHQSQQEFVGEVAAVLGEPRTATVVAATECHGLYLPQFEIESVIAKSPSLGVKLVRSLCRKLKGMAEAYTNVLEDVGATAGAGLSEIDLQNYLRGLRQMMDAAAEECSGESARRLRDYFLSTNPWRSRAAPPPAPSAPAECGPGCAPPEDI